MLKKEIKQMTFVGKVFAPSMMDAQRTYIEANSEVEADEGFKQFLAGKQLENKRASMVVFGPESFMYWYGVLIKGEVESPAGLMKYQLPAAEVAEDTIDGQISNFSMPLNFVIPEVMKKVGDSGMQVYENPGDSEVPYFVQALDLDTKKLTQIWYESAK